MKRIITLATAALTVGLVLPGTAMAQTAKDMVGTWSNVSNVNVRQDGSRVDIFGPKGTGLAIFDANGRFAIINGKIMQEGQPTAYVCGGMICSPPVTSAAILSHVLQLPENSPLMKTPAGTA